MSHIAYDFLADSLFLNQNAINSGFKEESAARIEKELLAYRQHIIKNIQAIVAEINRNDSALNVFSSSGNTPISLLKQTALYLEQYVVADPLFRFTNLETKSEQAMSSYLGFQEKVNLESLTQAASYLKEITPMVTGNFIKIFPVTYHFEAPKQLPIKIPINNNNDLLPKQIMAFFHDNCIVSPMEKIEGAGWAIFDGKELKPTRAINVRV